MTNRSLLNPVRDAANTMIGRNVRSGVGTVAPDAPVRSAPRAAIPMWNIPAKLAAAKTIAQEELALHFGHHNDAGDALRHAEWSKRMADSLGPNFSTAVGLGHEIQESIPHWSSRDRHCSPAAFGSQHGSLQQYRRCSGIKRRRADRSSTSANEARSWRHRRVSNLREKPVGIEWAGGAIVTYDTRGRSQLTIEFLTRVAYLFPYISGEHT